MDFLAFTTIPSPVIYYNDDDETSIENHEGMLPTDDDTATATAIPWTPTLEECETKRKASSPLVLRQRKPRQAHSPPLEYYQSKKKTKISFDTELQQKAVPCSTTSLVEDEHFDNMMLPLGSSGQHATIVMQSPEQHPRFDGNNSQQLLNSLVAYSKELYHQYSANERALASVQSKYQTCEKQVQLQTSQIQDLQQDKIHLQNQILDGLKLQQEQKEYICQLVKRAGYMIQSREQLNVQKISEIQQDMADFLSQQQQMHKSHAEKEEKKHPHFNWKEHLTVQRIGIITCIILVVFISGTLVGVVLSTAFTGSPPTNSFNHDHQKYHPNVAEYEQILKKLDSISTPSTQDYALLESPVRAPEEEVKSQQHEPTVLEQALPMDTNVLIQQDNNMDTIDGDHDRAAAVAVTRGVDTILGYPSDTTPDLVTDTQGSKIQHNAATIVTKNISLENTIANTIDRKHTATNTAMISSQNDDVWYFLNNKQLSKQHPIDKTAGGNVMNEDKDEDSRVSSNIRTDTWPHCTIFPTFWDYPQRQSISIPVAADRKPLENDEEEVKSIHQVHPFHTTEANVSLSPTAFNASLVDYTDVDELPIAPLSSSSSLIVLTKDVKVRNLLMSPTADALTPDLSSNVSWTYSRKNNQDFEKQATVFKNRSLTDIEIEIKLSSSDGNNHLSASFEMKQRISQSPMCLWKDVFRTNSDDLGLTLAPQPQNSIKDPVIILPSTRAHIDPRHSNESQNSVQVAPQHQEKQTVPKEYQSGCHGSKLCVLARGLNVIMTSDIFRQYHPEKWWWFMDIYPSPFMIGLMILVIVLHMIVDHQAWAWKYNEVTTELDLATEDYLSMVKAKQLKLERIAKSYTTPVKQHPSFKPSSLQKKKKKRKKRKASRSPVGHHHADKENDRPENMMVDNNTK